MKLAERILCTIWMVIGVSFYFVLIGVMSTYINSLDRTGKILDEKYMIITQFCTQAGIDKKLIKKISKMITYSTMNHRYAIFENNNILEDIPSYLRCEIAMNMNDGSMKKFNLFKIMDESLLGILVYNLQPFHLINGEIVYRRGDTANESNFVIIV